jgi:hypothetical protein
MLGACLAAGLALAATAPAAASLPVTVPAQHRVEVVIATDNERVAMTRLMGRGTVRTDLHDRAGAKAFATVIERPDKQAVYVLVPDRDLYLEAPIAQQSAPHGPDRSLRSDRLGRVTLNGRPADKFKLSNTHGVAHLWVEPRTRHPIRMQDDTARVTWSRFALGALPSALFEPPTRQTKLGIPDLLGGPNSALGQMMSDQLPLILAQQLGDDLAAKIRRASRMPLGVALGTFFGPTWQKLLLGSP